MVNGQAAQWYYIQIEIDTILEDADLKVSLLSSSLRP